jgi:hypothetical protein
VQKSVLLAAIQKEIQRHDFSYFVDEPPSVAQGGKGVVVSGWPACKKRFNATSEFLDHLANDTMPALINRLAGRVAQAHSQVYVSKTRRRLTLAGAKHQHVLATSKDRPSLQCNQRRRPRTGYRRARLGLALRTLPRNDALSSLVYNQKTSAPPTRFRGGNAMRSKFLPCWITPAIVKAAAVSTCILFVVSYAVDLTLLSFDVAPASTILNDIAIAVIATGVMLFYLFSTDTQHIFLRAKERMNLTAELNHHLRRVLTEFRSAVELEDRDERLRMLDQAIEDVDHILIELVPTVSGENSPRYTSTRKS